MAINSDVIDGLAGFVRIVRVGPRKRRVIQTRDINFGRSAITRRQNRNAIWVDRLRRVVTTQIDANEFAHPAYVANDPQAIAEIVGDKERLAIGRESQAGR